jgi:hypothetical protein
MLSVVLKDAVTDKVDGRVVNEAEVRELVTEIGRAIMDHFTAGETDPGLLKKVALQASSGLA